MIVKGEAYGGDTENECRLLFTLPSASIGKTVTLKRVSLPHLPMREAREAEIVCDSETYDLPSVGDLAELAAVMTTLINPAGEQICHCFFAMNVFEICVEGNDMVISESLAYYLNMIKVNLTAGVCYVSPISEKHMSESLYYRISVVPESMPIEGFHQNGTGFTQIIEEFSENEGPQGHPFRSINNTLNFTVVAECVTKAGEVVPIVVGDVELFGFWFEVA